MENKNNNNNNMPTCWADIQFGLDMPFGDIINLLNSFNQRLAILEDNVFIKDPDSDELISVTKYIDKETKKQMEEAATKNNEMQTA